MNWDKEQQMFFGLTEEQWNAGMRFDIANGRMVPAAEGSVKWRFPVVHEDGGPWTVESNRPNMSGTITGLTDG